MKSSSLRYERHVTGREQDRERERGETEGGEQGKGGLPGRPKIRRVENAPSVAIRKPKYIYMYMYMYTK